MKGSIQGFPNPGRPNPMHPTPEPPRSMLTSTTLDPRPGGHGFSIDRGIILFAVRGVESLFVEVIYLRLKHHPPILTSTAHPLEYVSV
jgi:hypothetical protein